MENIYHRYLNLPFEISKPLYFEKTLDTPQQKNLLEAEHSNEVVISWLKGLGCGIGCVECFYTPPLASIPIHTDDMDSDHVKTNMTWGPEGGVTRWWNQDSRTGTMVELEKIVNDTFTIIDNIYTSELQSKTGSSIDNNFYYKRSIPESYFKNENSQQLQSFSSELSNAIKGLQNLKLTYKNDISICSKIDVMIEKITIRIKKINSLLTIRPKDSSLTK